MRIPLSYPVCVLRWMFSDESLNCNLKCLILLHLMCERNIVCVSVPFYLYPCVCVSVLSFCVSLSMWLWLCLCFVFLCIFVCVIVSVCALQSPVCVCESINCCFVSAATKGDGISAGFQRWWCWAVDETYRLIFLTGPPLNLLSIGR